MAQRPLLPVEDAWAGGEGGWGVKSTRQVMRISEQIDYVYLIAFALEAATDPAGRRVLLVRRCMRRQP